MYLQSMLCMHLNALSYSRMCMVHALYMATYAVFQVPLFLMLTPSFQHPQTNAARYELCLYLYQPTAEDIWNP